MSDTLNVLVVVDVKNCFMKNIFSGKDDVTLNQRDEKNCIQMAKEIAGLTNKNDITVFTRDLHPLNHISFGEGSEGRTANFVETWPIHCRNVTQKCKSRPGFETEIPKAPEFNKMYKDITLNENNQDIINYITDKNLSEDKIKGSELSYYFYGTSISDVILKLNIENRSGKNKIGMKRSQSETQVEKINEINDTGTIDDIDFNSEHTEPLIINSKKFVTLTKGERCDQESYSAFNYHVSYIITNPSDPKINYAFNSLQENNSTGLWEWILNNRNGATNINITVCGLVGNVCVMHSVMQGKALWDNIYSTQPDNIAIISVNFCLSLIGTLFLEKDLPPGKAKYEFSELKDKFKTTKVNISGLGEHSLYSWMKFKYPSTPNIVFDTSFPTFESLFTPFEDRGGAQQKGGKKYKKCPKCKKNPYHGGKCFVCGFIPFLGKTKTQKRRRNGKKTRKNKRRFSRRRS